MDNLEQLHAKWAALDARISIVEDVEAIRRLRIAYHDLVNQGRISELSSLFHSDAVLVYPDTDPLIGRDAIGEFYTGYRVQWTRHFAAGHVVDVNGSAAVGSISIDARPMIKNAGYMFAGRFDDSYVKEQGQWLFKRVELTNWFMVPVSVSWSKQYVM